MAQLSDTVINGDLRISGQLYGGNVMAASLADYNSTSSPIYFGYGNDTPTDTSYLAGYTNVTSGMALKDISTGNVGVGYASHIGTKSSHPAIGGTNIPVYVNSDGSVTASLGNVGTDGKSLVYVNNGVIQKSGVTKGSPNLPVYISNGEVKECAYQIDKRQFYYYPAPYFTQSSQFSLFWAYDQAGGGLTQATYTPFTYVRDEYQRDRLVTYMFSNEANDEYAIFNLDFVSYYNTSPKYHHQLHSIVIPELGCGTITAIIKDAWFWDSAHSDWYENIQLLLSVDYRTSSQGGICGSFTGYASQNVILLDPR